MVSVAKTKPAEEASSPGPEDTWLSVADGEHAIRLRRLNTFLEKGGAVAEARLIEGEDRIWTIHLRLSGRKGEFTLHQFDNDSPRRYKDVALAINALFADLGYRGAIIISSERDYSAATRQITD